jgi:hypothetical protein
VCAGEETVLLVACADGAGSSDHSDIGSRLAGEQITSQIVTELESGLKVGDIDQPRFLQWYREVRNCLESEALLNNFSLREFACTLLTAVVGETHAALAQIGDGAILFAEGEGYQVATWPQSGEYVNTTFFVTDESLDEQVEFHSREGRLDELAMFTDGIEMLALVFSEKKAHTPFFSPMFAVLRETPTTDELSQALRDFLASDRVNERTDDDKTLVLATRRQHDGPHDAL